LNREAPDAEAWIAEALSGKRIGAQLIIGTHCRSRVDDVVA